MRSIRIVVATAVALLGGLASIFEARAEDAALERPRFELLAGAFFSTSDSQVELDSSTLGIGSRINLERVFGLEDEETVPRVDAIVRFGAERRHRLEASWFELSRRGQRTLSQQIRFGDRTFDVNADVFAEHDVNVVKLDYTYMFLADERSEAGISIGVFGLDQSISLGTVSRGFVEEGDLAFPLPTLGLRARWGITPRITAKAAADIFFIETGHYDGELNDVLAALELDVTRNLGIGLGYNYSGVNITESNRRGDLAADVSHNGPILYGRLSF